VEYWEPLVASFITSIVVGIGGCVLICTRTKRPRKTHLMNVFNQQFFALLFTTFFVRSFLWLVWADPTKTTDP